MTDDGWVLLLTTAAAVCTAGALWVVGQAVWRYGPRGRRNGRHQ